MSREGEYICIDCGRKYLNKEQLTQAHITTFFVGECYECKESKSITSIRHYNYGRIPKESNS